MPSGFFIAIQLKIVLLASSLKTYPFNGYPNPQSFAFL
ncbi:hypothetical protein RINTU1_17150 [Candidatus Regiella insecticola]|uniref:Uncharacterized protein n=1 Tax=Candidatus Regiella insecticola TaxID=138073 RepID=A0A6L2ZPA4_9ENTR|nr:hypothetical protein RINTU1_17150 [Candidatus Regiella insecticola]